MQCVHCRELVLRELNGISERLLCKHGAGFEAKQLRRIAVMHHFVNV